MKLPRHANITRIVSSASAGFILTCISGVYKFSVLPHEVYRYGFPLLWLQRTFLTWPSKPDYSLLWFGFLIDLIFWSGLAFLTLSLSTAFGIPRILRHGPTRIQLLLIVNLLAYAVVDVKIPEWLMGTWNIPDIHPYHVWILKWLYYLTVFLISASTLGIADFLIGATTGFLLLEFGTMDILYFLLQGRGLPLSWSWFRLHELFGIGGTIAYTSSSVILLSMISLALVATLNILHRKLTGKSP